MSADRHRVLVVEDHRDQALILARWLRRADLDVHVASDGEEGILLAQHGEFDAVLTDMQLPGHSGLEIVRASKQAARSRPVIMMTAHGQLDAAVAALREDADDFLTKPLTQRDVVSRLRGLLDAPRRARTQRTIVAVGAHPDDLEIAIGGTLARHVAEGDRVVLAICSRGSSGGDPERREREALAAAKRLGAELHVGSLTDTEISDGTPTISFLESIIARAKPDIVYTHSVHDQHQDHRAVHRATLVAARAARSLFCYQSPSTTIAFQPSRFVDISAHLATKAALLACHASQLDRPYLDDELVRATARYWGRFSGFSHAEPIEIVRSEPAS